MTDSQERAAATVGEAHADFENCATEPIHIPGAIQPHGLLFSVSEPELTIKQVSSNVVELLDIDASAYLGVTFDKLVQPAQAELLALSLDAHLETIDPITLTLQGRTESHVFDAMLHRSAGSLIIELEPASPAELSLHTSYRAMRAAANKLNAAVNLDELASVTAREIRALTHFDRVMIYRFDSDANGEVIAEAARLELSPFLGLHFPESDIPAQARALYLRNWLRIIPNSSYEPASLVPELDPETSEPLDLSASALRSVSPVHCQYLKNMGVRASMSISLIYKGRLWGLVACHHYSDSHFVPFAARSAAEFLGQTASVLIGAKEESAAFDQALLVRSVQSELLSALEEADEDPAAAVVDQRPNLADLVAADGVAVWSNGKLHTAGEVPTDAQLRALWSHFWDREKAADFVSTNSLVAREQKFAELASTASGVIAALSPARDQWVMWFRSEVLTTVTWAGNPNEKVVDIASPGGLGPRKSFADWTETSRGSAKQWTAHELLAAREFAQRLFLQADRNLQSQVGTALSEQAQFVLQRVPTIPGLTLAAEYRPSGGDSISGGDWFDVIPLPDSRVALVIGDVAGHGVVAASTMAQLRSGMRAYLVENSDPATALRHLNELVSWLLPTAMATGIVATVDRSNKAVQFSSAGHLPPLVIPADGDADLLRVERSPALGISDASNYQTTSVQLHEGDTLVMFTDGLIERRTETWDDGLRRLISCADQLDLDDLPAFLECMTQELHDSSPIADDVTILAMQLNDRP